MSEPQADYLSDAMEMMGAGYDQPAAVIEQPTKRLVLRDALDEVWTVAWVKLSTAFKPHIKELRGSPLAVWLYISLSINTNGVAFPGIRTIAEDTGYSHQGVIDAIEILEKKGYLKVRRGERRYNLYEPEFAAIGKTNEPSNESTKLTSQVLGSDESTFSPNESSGLDLNKKNKKEQDTRKKIINTSPEFAMLAGATHDELTEASEIWRSTEASQREFEEALGFSNPLRWDANKDWERFGEWVKTQYKNDTALFRKYAEWRKTPYTRGAMDNRRIRGFVTEFYDSWDMFLLSEKEKSTKNGKDRCL